MDKATKQLSKDRVIAQSYYLDICAKDCKARSGKIATCLRKVGHKGGCSHNLLTYDEFGNLQRW